MVAFRKPQKVDYYDWDELVKEKNKFNEIYKDFVEKNNITNPSPCLNTFMIAGINIRFKNIDNGNFYIEFPNGCIENINQSNKLVLVVYGYEQCAIMSMIKFFELYDKVI